MKAFPIIRNEKDIENAIMDFGFLPFFRSAIPGFSIEEMAKKSVWFPPKGEGVWEWKAPVIRNTNAAYGKFFNSRPCFVSQSLFMLLAAYRRDGYDFEGLENDGLITQNERKLYHILKESGSEESTYLRYRAGMSKSTFDSSNTRLQMRTFMMIAGFDYRITKDGKPYGWGIARYALPESIYPDLEKNIDAVPPEEAGILLMKHMKSIFPETEEMLLKHLID